MRKYVFASTLLLIAALPTNAVAAELEVNITPDKGFLLISQDSELIKIQRIQDTDNRIDGAFSKTSRACPPFCINPLVVEEGVTTVAELEVIQFLDEQYGRGKGVVVDARTPSWYKRGTIPGSINIPFTVFEKPEGDIELAEALESLGAVEREAPSAFMGVVEALGLFGGDMKTDTWDFSEAKDVLLWCNGPWCGQSPRAIRALVSLGFPEEKIYYYRGGMQMWQSLGLTTIKPKDGNVVAAR